MRGNASCRRLSVNTARAPARPLAYSRNESAPEEIGGCSRTAQNDMKNGPTKFVWPSQATGRCGEVSGALRRTRAAGRTSNNVHAKNSILCRTRIAICKPDGFARGGEFRAASERSGIPTKHLRDLPEIGQGARHQLAAKGCSLFRAVGGEAHRPGHRHGRKTQ